MQHHCQPRPEMSFRRWDSLTVDWRNRVQALNGSVSLQMMRSHDYLISALRSLNLIAGFNAAGGCFLTFSGTLQGSVAPLLRGPGITPAAVGVTGSDFSETFGFVQGGTISKYYDSGVSLGEAGLTGFWGGTYHGGELSAQRSICGALDGTGSTQQNLMMDYRRLGGNFAGAFRSPNPVQNPQPAEDSISAGTAGRIYACRGSTSVLKFYLRGALRSTNTTVQSGVWSPSITRRIWIGLRNDNGIPMLPANAVLTTAFFTTQILSDSQQTALDSVIREFLARSGRPTSDA